MNGFTLFLPSLEQWAIRVLKRALRTVDSPEMRQSAMGFVGQEGQHARAHAAFWPILDQQGYDTAGYRRAAAQLFKTLETRFSVAFNVAILAGFEHLTECIAEHCLRQDTFAQAEPELKALFEWHAAEEIEHKSVAYDLMVALGQAYWPRLASLVEGSVIGIGFLVWGLLLLLGQDKQLWKRSTGDDMVDFFFVKAGLFWPLCRNFAAYFVPSFHPSQRHNDELTEVVFNPAVSAG